MKTNTELISIGQFMKKLGQSRGNYYRLVKQNIPGFPQRVYPFGPASQTAKLVKKECEDYLNNLARQRDGKRRPGRPSKHPPAEPPVEFEL